MSSTDTTQKILSIYNSDVLRMSHAAVQAGRQPSTDPCPKGPGASKGRGSTASDPKMAAHTNPNHNLPAAMCPPPLAPSSQTPKDSASALSTPSCCRSWEPAFMISSISP